MHPCLHKTCLPEKLAANKVPYTKFKITGSIKTTFPFITWVVHISGCCVSMRHIHYSYFHRTGSIIFQETGDMPINSEVLMQPLFSVMEVTGGHTLLEQISYSIDPVEDISLFCQAQLIKWPEANSRRFCPNRKLNLTMLSHS